MYIHKIKKKVKIYLYNITKCINNSYIKTIENLKNNVPYSLFAFAISVIRKPFSMVKLRTENISSND